MGPLSDSYESRCRNVEMPDFILSHIVYYFVILCAYIACNYYIVTCISTWVFSETSHRVRLTLALPRSILRGYSGATELPETGCWPFGSHLLVPYPADMDGYGPYWIVGTYGLKKKSHSI